MEKVSREEKAQEAVKRMKILGIYPEIIKQFERYGQVSESVPPAGACYWLKSTQQERVNAFEADNNALVYHVIHAKYQFEGGDIMEMESYLYISDFPEEWEADREDLTQGQAFAYIYNNTEPAFSEFGYIGVELTAAAGLRRSW